MTAHLLLHAGINQLIKRKTKLTFWRCVLFELFSYVIDKTMQEKCKILSGNPKSFLELSITPVVETIISTLLIPLFVWASSLLLASGGTYLLHKLLLLSFLIQEVGTWVPSTCGTRNLPQQMFSSGEKFAIHVQCNGHFAFRTQLEPSVSSLCPEMY